MKKIELNTTFREEHNGLRLDIALANLLPEYSRGRIQQWIREDHASVDGIIRNQRFKVSTGQHIHLVAEIIVEIFDAAEDIPLNIVFEDEELLVINKSAGIVVHPGAGNREHTLLNALLHHHPALANLPRAGIIHRLDKDTSGLLIIAKTLASHHYLTSAMQERAISREYVALVQGNIISGGTIDLPIARHPTARTKMAVREDGKVACTHYRVKKRFHGFTLIDVALDTGRTHQIRVHMMHIKHPLVGDKMYGGQTRKPKGCPTELLKLVLQFPRQALHARKLSIVHPLNQQQISWEAEIPEDFNQLISSIEAFENEYS